MKKPRISFRHFSGSGPLSVYWHDSPYGDAVEATDGRGVAWLAPNGQLLPLGRCADSSHGRNLPCVRRSREHSDPPG